VIRHRPRLPRRRRGNVPPPRTDLSRSPRRGRE
jgi:hypothetical protein